LDSTVRLRILRLLTRLQNEHDLTYVLITHDLRSAQSVSDRVAVMLNGRIVEIGSTQAVLERPIHPYTRALLDAAPTLDPRMRESTMSAWTRQLHMAPTRASQVRPLREIGIDHHAAVD
jgi:ABC-type oligopeptide transport system ATPase subunit